MTAPRDNYNLSWTVNHPAISIKSHPYRGDACSMSQGRMERVEDLIKMKQYEVSGISLVRGNHLTIYLGEWYVCHSRRRTRRENALFIVTLCQIEGVFINIHGVSSMGTSLVSRDWFLWWVVVMDIINGKQLIRHNLHNGKSCRCMRLCLISNKPSRWIVCRHYMQYSVTATVQTTLFSRY